MKTIYADDMFLLNLIINYFIILSTVKLCALPLTRKRFALGAAVGALYSVLLLLPGFYPLALPPVKLLLGALITWLSFACRGRFLKLYIAFMAVSATFGGGVIAVSLLSGGSWQDGLYINVSMKVLLLSFAACYFALTLIFNRIAEKRSSEKTSVHLSLLGTTVKFQALYDTGNRLFDPLSGLPVMVVEAGCLAALFSAENLAALNSGAAEFIAGLDSQPLLRSRFRLVPYSSVGIKQSLLPVFRPDELVINGNTEKNLLVGISPNTLSDFGDFSALI